MPTRTTPRISSRKLPKQARSAQLVADILTAAAQVLARDGAHRFTTARVAEKAGVSVGSLYQYFPNKEAILFRLQFDEWGQTTALLTGILGDTSLAPLDRLRKMVHAFFLTEYEEAEMRVALGDASPFYRDAPEAAEHRRVATKAVAAFMLEALPGVPDAQRTLAADVIKMTMTAIGKSISEEDRPASQMEAYARAVGDMFCGYLEKLSADQTN